jgi:hypothetical protein
VVDWLGLLWLLGKVEMHASGKLEAAAKPLIWGGLALLLALPPHTRFSELTRSLRLRLMIALTVSQACWWTAVLIGLINSTLRRWTGA